MKKNETEIISYINSLKGYRGYIQMSDKPITDIWDDFGDISFEPQSGFVYEAHFFNGVSSITIRQINGCWLVSTTSLNEVQDEANDIQIYNAINGLKVRMAQIWKAENDPLCEGLSVLKLKKIVFVGFEGVQNANNSAL